MPKQRKMISLIARAPMCKLQNFITLNILGGNQKVGIAVFRREEKFKKTVSLDGQR